MGLITRGGKLLRIGNSLTTERNCCCTSNCCGGRILPDKLHLNVLETISNTQTYDQDVFHTPFGPPFGFDFNYTDLTFIYPQVFCNGDSLTITGLIVPTVPGVFSGGVPLLSCDPIFSFGHIVGVASNIFGPVPYDFIVVIEE